ncbi:hypothetical protein Tco_0206437 [Tanacetum coccineum]
MLSNTVKQPKGIAENVLVDFAVIKDMESINLDEDMDDVNIFGKEFAKKLELNPKLKPPPSNEQCNKIPAITTESVLSIRRIHAHDTAVDEPLAISLDEIQIEDKLNFIEEPVEIMDREFKRLKQRSIPIIQVMAALIISISSESSVESVGSHALRVILFGVNPAIILIIPEVPIILADPIVAPEVGTVTVVSPTGVLDLMDYSLES